MKKLQPWPTPSPSGLQAVTGASNRTHTSRRLLWFAYGLVLASSAACQRSPRASAGAPPASSAPPPVAPPSQSPAALAERLCASRPGCALRQSRALSKDGHLLELAIARATNKEACDGAEYWLIRGSTEALLASDCDAQNGADTRAHARVRVEPQQILVDYEEGLSSDSCAGASARLSPTDFRILDERRWGGTGRSESCARQVELAADWTSQRHTARWSSRACADRPASDAHTGDAIPSYQLAGVSEQTQLGSCAASVALGATTPATAGSAVRLLAAVVNAALFVEVSGVSAGKLSVSVASHSPDDGLMGSVGCGNADEYGFSSATIDLTSGQVVSRGKQAPQLKISARGQASIRLLAPGLAAVGRLALSFRGPHGERLDSARLSARPNAAELPPLNVWFQSKDPCELRAGRLEARLSPGPPPLLRLSGS